MKEIIINKFKYKLEIKFGRKTFYIKICGCIQIVFAKHVALKVKTDFIPVNKLEEN